VLARHERIRLNEVVERVGALCADRQLTEEGQEVEDDQANVGVRHDGRDVLVFGFGRVVGDHGCAPSVVPPLARTSAPRLLRRNPSQSCAMPTRTAYAPNARAKVTMPIVGWASTAMPNTIDKTPPIPSSHSFSMNSRKRTAAITSSTPVRMA